MGTVAIGYDNIINTSVLSGGSWDPALAYSQTRELMEYARSSSTLAAHTQFDCDHQSEKAAQLFAIFAHNAGALDAVRVTRGATAGAVDALDTGWLDVWRYQPMDNDYNGSWFPIMVLVNHSTTARYTRFEFSVSALLRFGRPWVSRIFRPTYNPVYGKIEMGWADQNSSVVYSQQGADFVSGRREIRKLSVEFPIMTPDDYETWSEIQRINGPTGEYVWVPSVENPREQQRSGFLAMIQKLPGSGHPHYGFRDSGCIMIERGGAP